MKHDVFNKLILFLNRIEQGKISYTLAHNRDSSIMIIVTVPGERWEIEFFEDGTVEVERFISNGEIQGEEALRELCDIYSDKENERVDLPQQLELSTA